MRKLLAAALLVAALAGCGGVGHHVRIEEDSPQWNCHTMGNHICGKEVR